VFQDGALVVGEGGVEQEQRQPGAEAALWVSAVVEAVGAVASDQRGDQGVGLAGEVAAGSNSPATG
jgi:hypothetical protein